MHMTQVQVDLERPLLLNSNRGSSNRRRAQDDSSAKQPLTQPCESSKNPPSKKTTKRKKTTTPTASAVPETLDSVDIVAAAAAAATANLSSTTTSTSNNSVDHHALFLTLLFFDLFFDLCIAPILEGQFIANSSSSQSSPISAFLNRMHTHMTKMHLFGRMYIQILSNLENNNAPVNQNSMFQIFLQTLESQGISFVA